MTDQPITYPTSVADATAHNVARHMARVANWRFRKMIDMPDIDGTWRANTAAMSAQFAVAYLLRELETRGHLDLADELARDLFERWDDGGGMGEFLWEWAAEYGMDPEGDDAVPLEPAERTPAAA